MAAGLAHHPRDCVHQPRQCPGDRVHMRPDSWRGFIYLTGLPQRLTAWLGNGVGVPFHLVTGGDRGGVGDTGDAGWDVRGGLWGLGVCGKGRHAGDECVSGAFTSTRRWKTD